MEAGPQRRLVSLTVEATHAPAHGGASVRLDGRIIGAVTSGDWGHRTGLNIAYAFVEPEFTAVGTAMTIDVLGVPMAAQIIESGPYNPDYSRMRA